MKALTRGRITGMLGRETTPQAERGLDVQVFRLRAVLGRAPSGRQYIQTIRGQGYIFIPGDRSSVEDHDGGGNIAETAPSLKAARFYDAVSYV